MQKSRRKKQKKPSVQDLQPDSIPSPSKLDSMPAEDRLESSAVLLLVSLFVAIIGQGLFLAVSVSRVMSACCRSLILMTVQCIDSHMSDELRSSESCTSGFFARELGPICAECGIQDILTNCWVFLGMLCCVRSVEGETCNQSQY